MTVKNFKVKNGLTVGTAATIYGNGNIDVAGIITAATFKGDGSGLINVTALGTGIQINNNGSIIGIGSIINFGTNIAVSPVFAGITTITGSTNPIPGISTTGSSFFNELQVGAAATFSGEVEVADYIRHKGDTNTAIRFPTDDTFSVVTGSLERFRVESDGEIGIGTGTPRAKLDVDGTIYSAGNIKLYDNVKAEFGDSADLKIYHNPSTSPDTNTIVSGSGQILELQTDKFRVVDFGASKDLIAADDGGSATLFYDGDVRLKTTGTGVDISDTLNVAGVSTFTGNSTFDGHIGIGTTAITGATVRIATDDTANSIEATRYNADDGGAIIFLQHSRSDTVGVAKSLSVNDEIGSIEFRSYAGNDTSISRAARILAIADADPTDTKVKSALVFETSNAGISGTADERLRITSDGKVGIGTDDPAHHLHLFGTDANLQFRVTKEGVGSFNHGVDSTGAFLETLSGDNIPIRFYTGGSERLRITPDGDVSIGASITVGGISKFNGSVGISSALLDKDGDKGSSGQVLSSTGSQVDWINVGSIAAGAASSIAITANNTTNETVYPLFVDGSSGNQGGEVDTGLTYNPSTGVLTATQFIGDVTGTTSLVTAVNNASDATCFPLFATQATGNIAPATNTNLTFDSTNGTLSATTFVGALTGNVSGTATGLSGTPDITVDEIGTRNINVSGVTTTAAVNWGGHMLPTSNASYDIGSAELKVRHLFLSDNSLKFVDSSDTEHPLSLDNGNLKFGKGLFLGTTIKADAASGIVTATTFKGALDGNAGTATVATNAQGLTGTPNITVGVLNASSGTVSGNLDVQGTLTYVNVDNVTSTGIGTFKKGIQIHGDGLDVVGIATFGTGIGVTGNITVTGNVDGRDINADGTKLDTIATSANNYTHPNHSGEVTSTGDGATLISSNVVDEDNLKISNTGTNGQFLQKQSGNTGGLTWATVDLYEWTLGGDGTNYTFTGPGLDGTVNDPELHLIRGQTYRFINNSGGHPFRIQSTVNGSAGTKYDDGVTNNDGGNGVTITFEVPQDAPNRLYYQCTAHGSMGGIINIGGGGVSDTATNGETVQAISSNWAFDHNAGTGNLKHVPAAGSSGQFLRYDGTWDTPPNTEYGLVDTSGNGLAPQLPASHGGKFLKADATWEVPPDTTYGTVSTSAAGLAPTLPSSHGGKFLKADGSWEVPAYISNTNDNDYVNSVSFATGTGVLTLGRTGSLGNLTVDLDGRYLQSHGLTFGAGLQLDGSAVSSTAAREQNITWTATVGTAVDMWTVAHNTADTFEITIYAKSGSHKQAQKMLVMHDGTTAHHNQYAVMYTSAARLYDFTAVISGTNLKIRVTPLTGADTSTNGSNVHWRYAVLGNSGN